jgi:hypothetical protein
MVAVHGPFTVDRTPPGVSPLLVDYWGQDPDAVTLEWIPDARTAGYQIDRALTPDFAVHDTFTTTSSGWIDVSPPAEAIVYYRVRGVNACGVLGD